MTHLPRKMEEELMSILMARGVILQSLYDLSPANVPLKHWFELNNDAEPVYHHMRRMPQKHEKSALDEI